MQQRGWKLHSNKTAFSFLFYTLSLQLRQPDGHRWWPFDRQQWSGGYCVALKWQGCEMTDEKANTQRSRPFTCWKKGEFVVMWVLHLQKQCHSCETEGAEMFPCLKLCVTWGFLFCLFFSHLWFRVGNNNMTWFSFFMHWKKVGPAWQDRSRLFG